MPHVQVHLMQVLCRWPQLVRLRQLLQTRFVITPKKISALVAVRERKVTGEQRGDGFLLRGLESAAPFA